MKRKRGFPAGTMSALAVAVCFGALVALPDRAQAQFAGGDQIDVAVQFVGGPYIDRITVGQGVGGVEVQSGDGSPLGGYFVPGESLDVGTDTVTLTIVRGMQGFFAIGSIDAPFVRTIQDISVTGSLSSEAHLVSNNDNQTSFASFTLDCNSAIPRNNPDFCNGGTVVLNITFTPLPPGEADTSVQGLIDFVVAQNFESCRARMLRKLRSAKTKIERNRIAKAIDELNLFINIASRCGKGGLIDAAVAESMVFTAGDIIASLSLRPPPPDAPSAKSTREVG